MLWATMISTRQKMQANRRRFRWPWRCSGMMRGFRALVIRENFIPQNGPSTQLIEATEGVSEEAPGIPAATTPPGAAGRPDAGL